MNAPLIDFVRRFRQAERANAAQATSSPPQPIVLLGHAAATSTQAHAGIASPEGRSVAR